MRTTFPRIPCAAAVLSVARSVQPLLVGTEPGAMLASCEVQDVRLGQGSQGKGRRWGSFPQSETSPSFAPSAEQMLLRKLKTRIWSRHPRGPHWLWAEWRLAAWASGLRWRWPSSLASYSARGGPGSPGKDRVTEGEQRSSTLARSCFKPEVPAGEFGDLLLTQEGRNT